MICLVRQTRNEDLEGCDGILKINVLLGGIGLSENFIVRALKCRSDGKHHNTS